VFATARSASALEDLAARGIETFSLDVTSLEDIRRARDTIDGLTGGKLDILVNNA
jgi:1-acylglycerone phosphate reductase